MIRITPKTEEEKIEHQEKIKINLAEEALRVSKLDDDGTDTPEELPPPSPLKSKTKHGYTVEILYHFTCVKCQQWWSYATTPGQPIIDQNSKCLKGDRLYLSDEIEMNCPHCGHLSLIDIKDGFFETLMPDEESGKKAQLELEELTELEKQELLVANQPSLSEMMQMYMPPGTDLKLPKQD
jgi:hypothetical protein